MTSHSDAGADKAPAQLHPATQPAYLLASQPIERVVRDGVEYLLLGTAHVSKSSVDAVNFLLESETFDAIAIELDPARHEAMRDPEAWKKLDLFQVIKSDRVGIVAANLALGAYQRRLAEQIGIEPGAEMLAASDGAQRRNLPLLLIDRDVGLTLARVRAGLGFWGGVKLSSGMLAGLWTDESVGQDDIEKLKQGDILQATFSEFAVESPGLYRALIGERDEFMAARLRQETLQAGLRKVLVVIGAGHLAGLKRALSEIQDAPEAVLAPLSAKPKPSLWPKLIGWGFMAVLLGGMLFGFWRGFDVGRELLLIYLGLTAGGTLLGALLALSHPLSAVSAALCAPLTVLHPLISSGMVSASVELWLRKPTVADFEALRTDLKTTSGWWRNRVAHTLLIFVLTNFGTMIGVWTTTFWFVKKLS